MDLFIFIYTYISSSCRTISTDIPDLLATPLYCPLLLASLQGYIPYWHRAAVCKFKLVVHLCEGVHRSTLLMSSPLLLQQCPTCLVHLILIVFVMGGRWPYSSWFVGCCFQELFNIACSILVYLLFLHMFSSCPRCASI